MKTQELQALLNDYREVGNAIRCQVVEVLQKMNYPIEFDWEDGCAPNMASCYFEDDLADCYITKIWYDRGLIKVNLHAYYLAEDAEDIDLADEPNADYAEILEYLLPYIPEMPTSTL